jgi:hypothetical protein
LIFWWFRYFSYIILHALFSQITFEDQFMKYASHDYFSIIYFSFRLYQSFFTNIYKRRPPHGRGFFWKRNLLPGAKGVLLWWLRTLWVSCREISSLSGVIQAILIFAKLQKITQKNTFFTISSAHSLVFKSEVRTKLKIACIAPESDEISLQFSHNVRCHQSETAVAPGNTK